MPETVNYATIDVQKLAKRSLIAWQNAPIGKVVSDSTSINNSTMKLMHLEYLVFHIGISFLQVHKDGDNRYNVNFRGV